MKPTLLPYEMLINAFVQGQLSASEFEAEYLKLFEYDNTDFTEEEYQILNTLFWAVDRFCANPKLREQEDLDENQLFNATQEALQGLKKLEAKEPTTLTIQFNSGIEISEELEKQLSRIIEKPLEKLLPQILETALLKKFEQLSSNTALFDKPELSQSATTPNLV
jgi:uncharacterized protein YicC (UPF0701 family)